jgi:hypothetical protein
MAQWRLTWCSGAHRGSMEAHGGAVEAHRGTVEVHHGAWKFTMAPWSHHGGNHHRFQTAIAKNQTDLSTAAINLPRSLKEDQMV